MATFVDEYFDFCKDLYEVRQNYSASDCIQILINQVKALEGADQDFQTAFLVLSKDSFTLDCRYVPVYRVCATGRYTWDEEKKETSSGEYVEVTLNTTTTYTQDRSFSFLEYKGIYRECALDYFVGSERSRYYELNLPSNLKHPIYSNNNYITLSTIQSKASSHCDSKKRNDKERCSLVECTTDAFFVPVVCISYVCNGVKYSSVVNMHNGHIHYEYKISEKSKQLGQQKYKTALIIRIATLVPGALFLLYGLYDTFCLSEAGVFGKILGLILFFIPLGLIFTLQVKMDVWDNDLAYFRNAFGHSTSDGKSALRTDIACCITAAVIYAAIAGLLYLLSSCS